MEKALLANAHFAVLKEFQELNLYSMTEPPSKVSIYDIQTIEEYVKIHNLYTKP